MESYQWQYRLTPEELKTNNKKVFLWGLVFYIGAAFIAIDTFFDTSRFPETNYVPYTISILGILLWHFVFIKKFRLKGFEYEIDEKGIKVYCKNAKINDFQWKDLKSFSLDNYIYTTNDKNNIDSRIPTTNHVHVEINKNKSFFTLMVDKNQKQKVIELLRKKLTELKK